MASPASPSLTFETLPAEIRNQIYDLCITEATSASTISRQRALLPEGRSSSAQYLISRYPYITRPILKGIQVSVLPGWTGPGKVKTLGIGPLPLLFVNKQVHHDVSSLVDEKAEEVHIGPYGLQFADEDPNLRWEKALGLLKRRPFLRNCVKSVKVSLPWLRRDLMKDYWLNRYGHKWEHKEEKAYGLMVIPNLVECLQNFSSLSNIEIILVAEVQDPPDMRPLLPLYDLGSASIIIKIIEPQIRSDLHSNAPSPLQEWVANWQRSLLCCRGLDDKGLEETI